MVSALPTSLGIFNAMDMQGKDEASQATLDKAIADAADGDEGERSEPERHEEAEAVLGTGCPSPVGRRTCLLLTNG